MRATAQDNKHLAGAVRAVRVAPYCGILLPPLPLLSVPSLCLSPRYVGSNPDRPDRNRNSVAGLGVSRVRPRTDPGPIPDRTPDRPLRVPLGRGCGNHRFPRSAWCLKAPASPTTRPGPVERATPKVPAALDPSHPTFLGTSAPPAGNPHSDRFRTRRLDGVHAMFRHWMQPLVVCSQPEKWSINMTASSFTAPEPKAPRKRKPKAAPAAAAAPEVAPAPEPQPVARRPAEGPAPQPGDQPGPEGGGEGLPLRDQAGDPR